MIIRKSGFILFIFLFSISLCGESRRIKNISEEFEEYSVSPQGIAVIDNVTYQFLPVFSDYKLRRISDGKFAVIGPNEEIRFYFYTVPVGNPLSQQEAVHVFKEGLLVPPRPDEDTLRLARHFLEHHTTEEVKNALLKNPKNEWMRSRVSENKWARLTSVANKFGLQRLQRYFEKFHAIAQYTEDPEFSHKAVSFLLLFQDPEIGLRYIEEEFPVPPGPGADSSHDIIQKKKKAIDQEYLSFTEEYVGNLIAPIQTALTGSISESDPLKDLLKKGVDVLLEDMSIGMIAIFYIVYEEQKQQQKEDIAAVFARAGIPNPFSNQNILIPLEEMQEKLQPIREDLEYLFDSLKRYFQEELVPVYRIDGSGSEFLTLEVTPSGTVNGKLIRTSRSVSNNSLHQDTEIVATKGSDGYFLARVEGGTPQQLRGMAPEVRISSRSFYIASPSEPSTIGKRYISTTFRWRGYLWNSKTVFRFGGRNHTPHFVYHLRIDTTGGTEEFSLDLQSPSLKFMEKIEDKYKDLGWSGHHFKMEEFTGWLRDYLRYHTPDELGVLLQNLILLLAPEEPVDKIEVDQTSYIFSGRLIVAV